MSCHKSGGAGEGWFTIAGTVYDGTKNATYPNATVSATAVTKAQPKGSG